MPKSQVVSLMEGAATTRKLIIPEGLDYRSGDYAHQGDAVDSWAKKWGNGIMEMATGSGKTITAMVAAARLQKIAEPLLVVVTAPFKPLLLQWAGEVEAFGVKPVCLSGKPPKTMAKLIGEATARLANRQSLTEVIIVGMSTFCTREFLESVRSIRAEKLLIADECHNLGAPRFVGNPPAFFKYRLGLSATPVRQYDEYGTGVLLDYFGDVCFSFPMSEAIGKCLCHYDYHIHWVEMAVQETAKWLHYTDYIREEARGLPEGKRSVKLDILCRNRHLLVEEAAGKLPAFKRVLGEYCGDDLKYALVYTTDKAPKQMERVNRFLAERGARWSQLTCEETSKKKVAEEILSAFKAGEIDVLTAKRVLDEGVNIPEIRLAFILASTAVKRQWIQRRGRLLRPSPATGKERAVIHDFITVPYGALEGRELNFDCRKMVKSELARVAEFAHMASNFDDPGGPGESIRMLEEMAEEGD